MNIITLEQLIVREKAHFLVYFERRINFQECLKDAFIKIKLNLILDPQVHIY